MNLFGLEIKLKNGKQKYVKEEVCEANRKSLGRSVDDLRAHIDTRFEDFKTFMLNHK